MLGYIEPSRGDNIKANLFECQQLLVFLHCFNLPDTGVLKRIEELKKKLKVIG